MGNIVIGIHGLSNKPAANTLENEWKRAILEGLNKNTTLDVQSIEFASVYWADVMYSNPLPNSHYRPAKEGALQRYEDGWLDILRKEAQDFGDNVLDKLKSLLGIDAIADEFLKKKFNDLHTYYRDANKRAELRGRLKEAILDHRDNRIMLVAHSMGSIIAYDVLRLLGKQEPSIKIDHFVTIGSPLGMPHVKYKITQESPLVRTPSVVRQWSNLSDRRDPVAIDTHLSDDYEPNGMGIRVKDDLVLNDWERPHHKSYGYLRTPEFTDIVKQFI